MARTAGTKYQHDWNDDTWTSGAPTTAAETLSGTTESVTGAIDARTYWGLQITADIDYDVTPTDSVTINVRGSIDGTNFDDTPIDYVLGNKAQDPEQLTIMIWNPPAYVKIGFVQSGSTDSHDISTVYYQGFN